MRVWRLWVLKQPSLPFGKVCNLWARYGREGPLLVFLGHTDVVPYGACPRVVLPALRGGCRGRLSLRAGECADMKGSIAAAMVTACERFMASRRDGLRGSLGLLVASSEEVSTRDGVSKVMDYLGEHGETIDWCLVGEPTSVESLGGG